MLFFNKIEIFKSDIHELQKPIFLINKFSVS